MPNIEVLDPAKHGGLTLRDGQTAGPAHLVPVLATELRELAIEMPVVLVKNPDTGAFGLFALTGFRSGENLFLDSQGQWQSDYVPFDVRRRPFVMVRRGDGEDGAIAIDLDDPAVVGDGTAAESARRPLFESTDGRPSPIDERREVLAAAMAGTAPTRALIDALTAHDLLAPGRIEVTDGADGDFALEGFYTVAPKAMTTLPADILVRMNRSGLLLAIHLLQFSMANVPVLLRKRAAATH